jgi:hypothetical protein
MFCVSALNKSGSGALDMIGLLLGIYGVLGECFPMEFVVAVARRRMLFHLSFSDVKFQLLEKFYHPFKVV